MVGVRAASGRSPTVDNERLRRYRRSDPDAHHRVRLGISVA